MKDKYLRKLKIELVDGEFQNEILGQVRAPEDIYSTFKKIKNEAQETLIAVYLTDDLEVIVYDVLSLGSSSSTLVEPRDIFGHGFITNAKYFILIHNHPKGDPTPSDGDKEVIEVLKYDAKKMKIGFLDFIIVGAESYWSMFEEEDGGEYSLGALS